LLQLRRAALEVYSAFSYTIDIGELSRDLAGKKDALGLAT
jgi:hypothetical protein